MGTGKLFNSYAFNPYHVKSIKCPATICKWWSLLSNKQEHWKSHFTRLKLFLLKTQTITTL